MQYYHPDFFQELVLGLGLDWCMFVQNGKTLGQFFELLYICSLNFISKDFDNFAKQILREIAFLKLLKLSKKCLSVFKKC